MNGSVSSYFFQTGAPKLERARRNSLLPLKIPRGNLNDPLIKHSILPVILEPDLFQCLVTLKEKLLVEFIDAFEKTGIIFGFHRYHRPCKITSGPPLGVATDPQEFTVRDRRTTGTVPFNALLKMPIAGF